MYDSSMYSTLEQEMNSPEVKELLRVGRLVCEGHSKGLTSSEVAEYFESTGMDRIAAAAIVLAADGHLCTEE